MPGYVPLFPNYGIYILYGLESFSCIDFVPIFPVFVLTMPIYSYSYGINSVWPLPLYSQYLSNKARGAVLFSFSENEKIINPDAEGGGVYVAFEVSKN